MSINTAECEARSYRVVARQNRANGRSVVVLECPFCKNEETAYLWSLAGSGKKCTCGALFCGRGLAYKMPAPPTKESP